MHLQSFLIGMFTSYFVGIIVSTINLITNKALYYRKCRKDSK